MENLIWKTYEMHYICFGKFVWKNLFQNVFYVLKILFYKSYFILENMLWNVFDKF